MTDDIFEIPERVEGQSAFDRLKSRQMGHRDYTYRVFMDFDFDASDLAQSIFSGSLWRQLCANKTQFQRCDFDGMQFEQCAFVDADFTNTDIRSSAFAGCRFERCCFDGALIDTCAFDTCVFDQCEFESAVQRLCTFSDCDLRNYSLVKSSFTKCRIDRSRLEHLQLCDCTFLYVILRGCKLNDITLNVESLGTVFGITRDDLLNLRFVHLGHEATPLATSDLPAHMEATYEKTRWALALAITRLNFDLTSVAFAINCYLQDVEGQAAQGRRLRYEEIEFLQEVFTALSEDERLPLINLSQLGSVLQNARSNSISTAADNRLSGDTLARLSAKTTELVRNSLDRLADAITGVDLDDHRPIWIECLYEEVPRIDVPRLMADATVAAGLPLRMLPIRKSVRRGSYIEVVQASLATAFAFQIFLYALNGVLVQLTELKARIQALSRKHVPRQFELVARTEHQSIPPALRLPLSKILKFASLGDWFQKPDLDGIDNRNLRRVNLLTPDVSETKGPDQSPSDTH